jgi:hypothetical protein
VKLIWKQLRALLTLAMQDEEQITEEKWLCMSKQFSTNFTARYCDEDVTLYIHVFVYHIGYYLEKYGNLELFTNYTIEGHHHYNKVAIQSGTNDFSNADSAHNLQYQLLTYSWQKQQSVPLPSQLWKHHQPSWRFEYTQSKWCNYVCGYRYRKLLVLLCHVFVKKWTYNSTHHMYLHVSQWNSNCIFNW